MFKSIEKPVNLRVDDIVHSTVKTVGKVPQSTNDPFNQNNIISFKLNAVGAVLNPSCGRILMTHEKT